MKFITPFLLLIVTSVNADSTCSKNAWIKICVNSQSGKDIKGDFYITGGKDANDIDIQTLTIAVNKFVGGSCAISRDYNSIQCITDNQWRSSYWSGKMNIEFDCNTYQYMAYSADWKSRDYYC